MTAITSHADPLAKALTPLIRDLLLEEVRRHAASERAKTAAQVDVQINAEIDAACREVAWASDRYVAARYSGIPEASAHRKLVKATMHMSAVMRKHGRMPRGAR
jgi:hypothetical protein